MTQPLNEVYVVSAVRTPIGSFCGKLSTLKASQLGTVVIKEALAKAAIQPEDVSEVIMGQVLTSLEGQNPARQAAVNAGVPHSVPAYTVNMLCSSGLKSVMLASQSIQLGQSDIVVCGGQESMSQAPHSIHMRAGLKMGNSDFKDTMLHDGLTDAFSHHHMGLTAENIVKKCEISREDQDRFACESQNKVEEAQKSGKFKDEIVPVTIKDRRGAVTIENDEFPRHGTTLESLAKLRPAFLPDGTVTAGNASGLNDGAAAVVLISGSELQKRQLTPLARIVSYSQTALDPQLMGLGPIEAIKKALRIAQWDISSVDLFELNEAFAAQSLAVLRDLGLDASKVNVNGGAIALGHPIGASGARVLVTLLHSMARLNAKRGVTALCVGGGMGVAICVERTA